METVADYHLISLTHSFSKMLGSRLVPLLPEMVSPRQSTFIKQWCTHDNFLHVQGLIKEMQKDKTPGFFLKLGLANVFDTVGWTYLVDILVALGVQT